MSFSPFHAITIIVPDAENESTFLQLACQAALKAYRLAHPVPKPPDASLKTGEQPLSNSNGESSAA